MQSPASQLPFFSTPLATALEKISFRIKHEGTVHMVAATATLAELKKEQLPKHISVTERPLKGKRVVVRRTRNFRQTRLRVARYPESQMDEVAIPILLCVISGTAKIYAGNYALTCRPGDFVTIPPMVPKGDYLSHAIDSDPKSTCDVLYLYPGRLLGEGLECWISRSQGNKILNSAQLGAALLKNPFTASLFSQLCQEAQNSARSEATFLLTKSLIHFLLRELREKRAILPDIKRLHRPIEHSRDPIQYALTYIESNLGAPLTVGLMARETALSTTSFNQLFRKRTGTSFHRYLTDLRLQFAEKLLRETDLQVREVAEQIGLSPSRLNRQFHAKYGMPPGEFRKSD